MEERTLPTETLLELFAIQTNKKVNKTKKEKKKRKTSQKISERRWRTCVVYFCILKLFSCVYVYVRVLFLTHYFYFIFLF